MKKHILFIKRTQTENYMDFYVLLDIVKFSHATTLYRFIVI